MLSRTWLVTDKCNCMMVVFFFIGSGGFIVCAREYAGGAHVGWGGADIVRLDSVAGTVWSMGAAVAHPAIASPGSRTARGVRKQKNPIFAKAERWAGTGMEGELGRWEDVPRSSLTGFPNLTGWV